jgi:glutaredoxin-related protein
MITVIKSKNVSAVKENFVQISFKNFKTFLYLHDQHPRHNQCLFPSHRCLIRTKTHTTEI